MKQSQSQLSDFTRFPIIGRDCKLVCPKPQNVLILLVAGVAQGGDNLRSSSP
jgi:hypothetical protein